MSLKIVYSTFPSVVSAEAAARKLVEARLAACGNILPAMISVYEWQGSLERADEVVLLLKTSAEKAAALMEALRQDHPYEVPAILLLPVEEASPAFAAWVVAQTGR
ncbi:MAG: divalent-cation tolerance protein CutA [Rhizobiales bacterium 17-65-6]|nr:MAG: divalent-cation tolerance protein CutA [Azorhizobium sp. 32-67-21]OZA01340.1 MAG: divalent-cation tolerance protein CutA [Rhizobiales bacterium 17-65-6]